MEIAAAAAEEEQEVCLRKAAAAALKLNKRTLSRRELSFSSPLKYRRKIASSAAAENSISTPSSVSENSNDQPSTPTSDQAIQSCCSTHKVLEEDEASSVEISTWATYDLKIRERETTPSRESAELETTAARPSEANSSHRSTEVKMPSEAELEDFFSKAEKGLHKQFAEKYNFDIVKEEPLEGRYEWIPLTRSSTSPVKDRYGSKIGN